GGSTVEHFLEGVRRLMPASDDRQVTNAPVIDATKQVLAGLRGEADADRDGIVTRDELASYLTRQGASVVLVDQRLQGLSGRENPSSCQLSIQAQQIWRNQIAALYTTAATAYSNQNWRVALSALDRLFAQEPTNVAARSLKAHVLEAERRA